MHDSAHSSPKLSFVLYFYAVSGKRFISRTQNFLHDSTFVLANEIEGNLSSFVCKGIPLLEDICIRSGYECEQLLFHN